MVDSGPTQARGSGGPPGQLEIIRRTSFGMTVALLIQYALGMVVNLYLTGEPGAAPAAVRRTAETRDGTRQDAA